MLRLFTAIDLPQEVKARLAGLKADIPTARWVEPRAMHLTLRFIGEVTVEHMPAIKKALAQIEAARFSLTVDGVGRFPASSSKAPRVVWAGLQPEPLLMDLQRAVEQALILAGCNLVRDDYHPHLTLARLKAFKPNPALTRALDAFLAQNQSLTLPPFPVNAFVLYSSVLSRQGPHYTREAVYPLMPGS